MNRRFADMTAEERKAVRDERARVQRERDERAKRYALEHPVSPEERDALRRAMGMSR